MAAIGVNFNLQRAEEQRLLAIRTADSQRTRAVLLGIDLAGVALILMLAFILMREARRSNLKLETSLNASKAENESLEAAVAERTEHLLAAHEQLRRSASVLQSTFNSMAEAVLVIDTTGAVVLSNAAAEQTLRYRAGMTVHDLRKHIVIHHAGTMTPMSPDEMPAARALRGEIRRQGNRRQPERRPRSDPPCDQRPPATRCVRRNQRRRACLP
jgi:PAS domain-containing protein